ncbi:MAG: phage head closure protein [Hyphomicrobiaceae bacterium]
MTVIGTLRHRITLESPQRIATEGGAASVAWNPVADVFAQVKPLAGREIVSADGVSARLTHEIVIRWRSDLEPRMRIRLDGRVLDIHAVLDVDARRRWLRCLCEERQA